MRVGSHSRVPLRGLGRTIKMREDWIAAHTLRALQSASVVPRGATLTPRESPDRLLSYPGRNIGIEITEVVPEAYARADAIRNRSSPDLIVDRSHYQPGGRGERSEPQAMLRSPDSKDRSPGWPGHAVEQELAGMVLGALSSKTEKLNEHFERFDEDWLVIYASEPGPSPCLARTRSLVALPESRSSDREFHRVFLLLDRTLLCLRSGATYPVSAV